MELRESFGEGKWRLRRVFSNPLKTKKWNW
jgi:hypothetical protein